MSDEQREQQAQNEVQAPYSYYHEYLDDGSLDDDYDDEWYEDVEPYGDEHAANDNSFAEIWRLERANFRVRLLLTRIKVRQTINGWGWKLRWWAQRQLDRLRGIPVEDPNDIPF